MSIENQIYYDGNRRWSYNGSITSQRKSVSSSRGSLDNDSSMVWTYVNEKKQNIRKDVCVKD
jgi:hypothetical protein